MADEMKILNEDALEKVTGGMEETLSYTIENLPAGDDPMERLMGSLICKTCGESMRISRRKQIEPFVLGHTNWSGHTLYEFIEK